MTGLLLAVSLAGCTSQPLSPSESEIKEILLVPESVESQVGRMAKFVVEALDGNGRTIPNAKIEWDTADPTIAVVDPDGTVWSFKEGSVDVTAHPGKGGGTATAPGQVKKNARVTVQATQQERPAQVDDLRVESIQNSTVHLAFTEVDDGTGAPADYIVRFQIAPLEWNTAANVTFGTCAGSLSGTTIGATRTCSVSNLVEGTTYEFQLIAVRGSSSDPTYGDLSNIESVTMPSSTASFEGVLTQHTFTEPLEDGWTDRGEGNYSHGFENGDGFGQANYPTHLCVGCGPIQVRRGFSETDELTVKMRWQVSENMNYLTGSKAKKIFFLETPKANPIYLALAGDNYQLALFTQSTAEGASRAQGGPATKPGRIHDVKLYIKLNSVDASGNSKSDGIATVWLDGERIVHRTDMRFRGEDSPQKSSGRYFAADDGISGIRWNPTWPGGGDPPAELMWERLYDIAVWSGSGD